MKKLLSILLLFVYSCSFVCLGYNLHFCGGHLKSVTLAQFHKAGCCNKMEKPNGCCKDVFLKCKSSDQTQTKVVMAGSAKADSSYVTAPVEEQIERCFPITLNNEHATGDPPDFLSRRLYIANRRLLI